MTTEQLVEVREIIKKVDVTDEERELLMLLLQSYRGARDG